MITHSPLQREGPCGREISIHIKCPPSHSVYYVSGSFVGPVRTIGLNSQHHQYRMGCSRTFSRVPLFLVAIITPILAQGQCLFSLFPQVRFMANYLNDGITHMLESHFTIHGLVCSPDRGHQRKHQLHIMYRYSH